MTVMLLLFDRVSVHWSLSHLCHIFLVCYGEKYFKIFKLFLIIHI